MKPRIKTDVEIELAHDYGDETAKAERVVPEIDLLAARQKRRLIDAQLRQEKQ